MENQITQAPEASSIKKAIIALTALLVVGGAVTAVYLNMGTGQGDPNEPPPSLSVAGGGLKGSFADESTQGFLQYTTEDATKFENEKSALASKWGAAGTVKAGVNFYTINTDGLTMADLVKNYNPKQDGNRALFVIYSAGQYMNGTTPLVKGFHTYPAGPFGAATNEIKKEDLSKINLPRNSGVIIISRSQTENNGILDASVAPAGKITGSLLPDNKKGWVLVSGNGKLADLLGADKSRVVSAWGLKNATDFEKVDLNTYEFSTYHIAWVNLAEKSSVTDTPASTLPTITKIEPATAEQGQKAVPFTITGTNLAGATVSFTPSTDFKNIIGLNVDPTNTMVKFLADIDESAKPDEFKEIKLTTSAGSVTDKTKFKVTAKAAKPVLKEISVTEGVIDTLINIVITGDNIANINNLKIGNVTAQTVFTDVTGGKKEAVFTLLDTVPVGSQDLVVVNPAGTSNALKFNVKPSTTSMVGKDVLVQYSPDDKKTFSDQWFEAKVTRVTPTSFLGIKLNTYDITYKYPIKRNTSNNQYYALTSGPGALVTNLAGNQVAVPADSAYLDTGKDFLVIVKQPDEKFGLSAKFNGKNTNGLYSITYNGQTSAKEKAISNIYKPLSVVKIPVETVSTPAGTITDKGSDTTPPAKFTFVSPTPDGKQSFDLDDTKKNGFLFTATDPNTKSHLKAENGKFYMSYAWELKKGNNVVWESGWVNAFPSNPEGKTCVINVTNPEGNRVDIWSCPSAVIPAEKLKDITAGTYTLTGWLGDGKDSPEPTSVTFKIEGAAATSTTTSFDALGRANDFGWYKAKATLKTVDNKATYDVIYSDDSGNKDLGVGPERVVDFSKHPPIGELVVGQKVIIEDPKTSNSYWDATVKSLNSPFWPSPATTVTVTYGDKAAEATLDISKIWITLAGKTMAGSDFPPLNENSGATPSQEIIKAIQDKIDIKVTPYAINATTGNAMLRYTVDASKVDVEKIKTYGENGYFVKVKTYVDNVQVQPKFSTSSVNNSSYYEEVSNMLFSNEILPDEIAIYFDNSKNKTCAYWAKKGKTCAGMEPVVLPASPAVGNSAYNNDKSHLWFDAKNLNNYQVRFDFYRDGSDKPVASYDRAFNLKADLSVTALTPATKDSSETNEFKTFYCNVNYQYTCEYPTTAYNNMLTLGKPSQPDYFIAAKQGYQGIKLMNKVTDNNYGIILDPSKYALKIYGKYAGDTGLYELMKIDGDKLNKYSSNKEANGYVLNANKIACGTAPLCGSDPKTNANAVLPIPGPGGTNYLFIPRDEMKVKNGVYGDITKVELVSGDKVISTFSK